MYSELTHLLRSSNNYLGQPLLFPMGSAAPWWLPRERQSGRRKPRLWNQAGLASSLAFPLGSKVTLCKVLLPPNPSLRAQPPPQGPCRAVVRPVIMDIKQSTQKHSDGSYHH